MISYLERLTMEVIWKSIFDMDVDVQHNPNLNYYVMLKKAKDGIDSFSLLTQILSNHFKSFAYNYESIILNVIILF